MPPPLLESPTTTNDQSSPPYSPISVEKSFQQQSVKRHSGTRKEVILRPRAFAVALALWFDCEWAFFMPHKYTRPEDIVKPALKMRECARVRVVFLTSSQKCSRTERRCGGEVRRLSNDHQPSLFWPFSREGYYTILPATVFASVTKLCALQRKDKPNGMPAVRNGRTVTFQLC